MPSDLYQKLADVNPQPEPQTEFTLDIAQALVALRTRPDLHITRAESEYDSRVLLYSPDDKRDSEPLTLLDRQCNGIVFEKSTEKVLCHCQSKFTLVDDTFTTLPGDVVKYTDDGTTVRLYFYNDKWYTATTKCMDARYSKFSSEYSFDEMFWDVFPKTALDSLDKNCTYIFILRHTLNRIVLKYNKDSLVFISRVDNQTGTEFKDDDFVTGLPAVFKEDLYDGGSLAKLKRGVMIRRGDSTYMYDYTRYTQIEELRGNDKDILFRYITLLVKDTAKALELLRVYPEHIRDFARVNCNLHSVFQIIFKIFKSDKSLSKKHMYTKMLKKFNDTDTVQEAAQKFYSTSPGYLHALINRRASNP